MRRLVWRLLPPIAPPVDANNAAVFPNIASAPETARKLEEQWPDHWRKA